MTTEPSSIDHAWVIGGTGMLAGVSEALASRTSQLTVVARTQASLARLRENLEGSADRHHSLALDWSDPDGFLRSLRHHAERLGPPDLTVAWLHDHEFGPRVAETVRSETSTATFLQVCGSRTPERFDSPVLTGIVYRRVILGAVPTASGARWLTHAEIVDGVLGALEVEEPRVIVGSIDPAHLP